MMSAELKWPIDRQRLQLVVVFVQRNVPRNLRRNKKLGQNIKTLCLDYFFGQIRPTQNSWNQTDRISQHCTFDRIHLWQYFERQQCQAQHVQQLK